MQKICAVLAGMLVLFLLTGCVDALRISSGEGEKAVKAYTSFYTMYDFAVKIGGDRTEVINMMPDGGEPHDWEPGPADIAGLRQADVFIYSGAGMEHWADDVLSTLNNAALISVQASDGITLLEEHPSHSQSPGGYDPHVWLDPKNAKIQMQNIADAFIAADPEGREYYEANLRAVLHKLEELDLEYRQALDGITNRDIVVTHQAFGYLCAAYSLNQVAIEGSEPDSEPRPSRVAEVIEFVRERDVKMIFFEDISGARVAEVIARETGVETGMLSPLEGLSDIQRQDGDDYFAVMRQNLSMLKLALG